MISKAKMFQWAEVIVYFKINHDEKYYHRFIKKTYKFKS